ncbi:MAG: hypothetical protein D6744_03310 [Planctomycetota bacterium]|nr:MAG: hypothetical protein D6744_03310 [Planctomycetota bacterium]
MNANATNTTTNETTKTVDKILGGIAREIFDLETLETRNANHLDFHDLGVWQIRKALRMAYDAGYLSAIQDAIGT